MAGYLQKTQLPNSQLRQLLTDYNSSTRGPMPLVSEDTYIHIAIYTHIHIILKVKTFLNVSMLDEGLFCYILTWWMARGQKETNALSSNSRIEGANLLLETLKITTLFIRAILIRFHFSTLLHWNNLNTNVWRRQKQSNYSTKGLLVLL